MKEVFNHKRGTFVKRFHLERKTLNYIVVLSVVIAMLSLLLFFLPLSNSSSLLAFESQSNNQESVSENLMFKSSMGDMSVEDARTLSEKEKRSLFEKIVKKISEIFYGDAIYYNGTNYSMPEIPEYPEEINWTKINHTIIDYPNNDSSDDSDGDSDDNDTIVSPPSSGGGGGSTTPDPEPVPECSLASDCGTDGLFGSLSCHATLNSTIQDYVTFSCNAGVCENTTVEEIQENCTGGDICSSGSCVSPPECSIASDCGTDGLFGSLSCHATLNSTIQDYVTFSCNAGVCENTTVEEIQENCTGGDICSFGSCVSPPECSIASDCGADGLFGSSSCHATLNSTIQDYVTFSCNAGVCENTTVEEIQENCTGGDICSSGSCVSPPECSIASDCGTDGLFGSLSCHATLNSTIQDYVTFSCNAGICENTTVEEIQENCTGGDICSSGSCVSPPECSLASDCGADGFVGDISCHATLNSTVQDYVTYTCEVNQTCSNTTVSQIKENCSVGDVCSAGTCVTQEIQNTAPELSIFSISGTQIDMPGEVQLSGTATDNTTAQENLTYYWEKLFGPGIVSFEDILNKKTKVIVDTPGDYILKLTVSDGEFNTSQNVSFNAYDSEVLDLGITYPDFPKEISDKSNYVNEYLLDIVSYNISNTGTNSVETTQGLIDALNFYDSIEKVKIVLPTGTYLINESNPILINQTNMIIDLNGSTLKMATNGLDSNSMFIINDGTDNLRLTNGILLGDRNSHDYATIATDHIYCHAIKFVSGKNIEIDNLDVKEFTGTAFYVDDGIEISVSNGDDINVTTINLESGGFNSTGAKVTNAQKTRTINPYNISNFDNKEFEFGYSWGSFAFPEINDREYIAYFYDSEMTFIEQRTVYQYRKESFPNNTVFVNFEFNESSIPTGSPVGRITNVKSPREVHVHDNYFYRNRVTANEFRGGQRWLVEDNLYVMNSFENDNVSAAPLPGWTIYSENGWNLMYDIIFRGNNFTNNYKDMMIDSGNEIMVENNFFDEGVQFNQGSGNYIFRNNTVIGENESGSWSAHVNLEANGYTRKPMGISVHHNYYEGVESLDMNYAINLNEMIFNYETFINVPNMAGRQMIVKNSILDNVKIVAAFFTDYVYFENVEYRNNTELSLMAMGPDVNLTEINVTGTLLKTGTTSRLI